MTNSDAIAALARLFGDRLTTGLAERQNHGNNETHYPQALPDAVVYPETTEEVSALLKLCNAALRPGRLRWPMDVCIPISKMAEAVVQAQNDAKALGLTSTIVGHVGDGNFHAGGSVRPDDPDEMSRAEVFTTALAETALRLGGTVSGEHGVGVGKQKFMAAEHGAALEQMRAIKQAFDPNNILNPSKLLPKEG